MGQRVHSCFSRLLGCCRRMPNNPTLNHDVPHEDHEPHEDNEPHGDHEVHEVPHDVGLPKMAIDSGKMCDLFLNRIVECSNRARKMISGLSEYGVIKLNPNQCEYLVEGLEIAVRNTKKSFLHSSREHEAQCLEALKFLHRLAKEVEIFIQRCCCNDKTWLQVALTSASEGVRVSSIGYNLKLCTMLVRDWNMLGGAWLTFSEMKLNRSWEVNLAMVQEKVSLDEEKLLGLLGSEMTVLSLSEITEVEVASILRKRLTLKQVEQMSMLDEDRFKFWEIDRKHLSQHGRLGAGSDAVTFKSKWQLGGLEVSEKMYSYYDRRFAREEMLSLAMLSHPNIVSLLGVTMGAGDEPYVRSIVTELMDGDLRTLMQQRMQQDSTLIAPFSICEACDIMLQIAEGVCYMHENGIIHSDLKSTNIVVQSSKEEDDNKIVYAKVADMGLSKMNVRSSTMSNPTWGVGTTRWMAPEVSRLPERIDEDGAKRTRSPYKSDVYSFSMVCYEILTGSVPFEWIESNTAVKKMVLAGERPPLPSHCPQDLQDLIKLCWDLKPRARPSFVEICEELRYIKCSLFLEPIDQGLHTTLPIPKPLDLPPGVLQFKIDYSSLKVVKLLAKGGSDFVTLYVSSWQKGRKKIDVAQKHFLGACNKSFINEVSILAYLKDDNIIRLLCYASDRSSCSIVMDLMDGDLFSFINTRKPNLKGNSMCTSLSFMPEALHIMVQIAQGMQYIHGKRIVHRDLKSKNILVKARGKTGGDIIGWDVKVADFGFSLKMENRVVLNKASAVGTIRWTAPEIVQEVMNHVDNELEGPSNCDYDPFKCDVYSFGMVCYEILARNVPFHEIEDLEEVKERIMTSKHPPLSLPEGTSSNVKDLVEKCWLKDASKRPSFVEIVEMLKADQHV